MASKVSYQTSSTPSMAHARHSFPRVRVMRMSASPTKPAQPSALYRGRTSWTGIGSSPPLLGTHTAICGWCALRFFICPCSPSPLELWYRRRFRRIFHRGAPVLHRVQYVLFHRHICCAVQARVEAFYVARRHTCGRGKSCWRISQ